MAIHIVVGLRGAGKTLVAVLLAFLKFNQGRKIYSNIKLEFSHEKTPKITEDFANNLNNCVILIDEIETIAHSSGYMRRENRMLGLMAEQSRKSHVDIIATLPEFWELDKALRRAYDYIYTCSAFKRTNGVLYPASPEDIDENRVDIIKYSRYDRRSHKTRFFQVNVKDGIGLYNSDERVPINFGK